MTNAEWANYIDSNNTVYDEEGMSNGVVSTTLDHLSKYLRADLLNPTLLLHALATRVWRDAPKNTRITLQTTAFLFHVYHFYYIGNDEFSIHRNNRRAGLLGVLPTYTSDEDWENYNYQYHGGHPEFGIVTRSPASLSFDTDTHPPTYGINGYHITFVDYGDNGVAIDAQDAVYFLSWPDEYENAVDALFTPVDGEYDIVDVDDYDSVC